MNEFVKCLETDNLTELIRLLETGFIDKNYFGYASYNYVKGVDYMPIEIICEHNSEKIFNYMCDNGFINSSCGYYSIVPKIIRNGNSSMVRRLLECRYYTKSGVVSLTDDIEYAYKMRKYDIMELLVNYAIDNSYHMDSPLLTISKFAGHNPLNYNIIEHIFDNCDNPKDATLTYEENCIKRINGIDSGAVCRCLLNILRNGKLINDDYDDNGAIDNVLKCKETLINAIVERNTVLNTQS